MSLHTVCAVESVIRAILLSKCMLMNSRVLGNITSHTGSVANVEANGERISNTVLHIRTERKHTSGERCVCVLYAFKVECAICSLIVKRVKMSVVLNEYNELSSMWNVLIIRGCWWVYVRVDWKCFQSQRWTNVLVAKKYEYANKLDNVATILCQHSILAVFVESQWLSARKRKKKINGIKLNATMHVSGSVVCGIPFRMCWVFEATGFHLTLA